MYLVQHMLEESARRLPDKVALICGDQRLTYSEINEKADRLAAVLVEMGIERQDRVAIFMDNSAESVISLFGILKACAIFVMINASIKERKLKYMLKNAGASILVAHKNKFRIVKAALEDLPALENIIWVEKNGKGIDTENGIKNIDWEKIETNSSLPNKKKHISNIDTDLAAIIYTSGSTGEPKGVMCAHYNVMSVARSISLYLENNEDDIVLCTLPLSFGYGLYQVMVAFLTGGAVVLEKSFAFPFRIMERLVSEKVTGFALVPTMAALLLQMEGIAKLDFGSLRYVTNAASALPVAHIRKLQSLWPSTKIYSMYGLTECVRASYLPPDLLNERPDSVGIPISNEEVRIVDKEGGKVGPNETGELLIRGSNVMQGYWRNPEETRLRFIRDDSTSDVWLHTGDLFQKDKDGFLYFVARKDDLINTRGERVSPKEIENCLCEFDGIIEAVVIGVPNEVLGQAIKAYVVSKNPDQVNEAKLRKHIKDNLEPLMAPTAIEIKDNLPRLFNGKIDKKQLCF